MTLKMVFSVLLAFLLVSSMAMACFSGIQAQSVPSVPEFTVQYVNHPYDLAPTYTVDPYTGQTEVVSHGGHFDNYTVEIKIKNQAFTSTIDQSGNQTSLYYNIRFKGHYEENWTYYPVVPTDYGAASHPVDPFQTGARGSQYIDASKTDYTTVTLPQWQTSSVKQGGEIDVQVQALIGHDNVHDWGAVLMGSELITYYFEGQYTDWSSTQTVKIDDGAAETASSPTAPAASVTQNPSTVPSTQSNAISTGSMPSLELLALVALGIVIVLLVVVVAFMSRKIRVLERKIAT